jgi:hypothetical protein
MQQIPTGLKAKWNPHRIPFWMIADVVKWSFIAVYGALLLKLADFRRLFQLGGRELPFSTSRVFKMAFQVLL